MAATVQVPGSGAVQVLGAVYAIPTGIDGTPVSPSIALSTTDNGATRVRNITLNSTAAVVKASAGNLYKVNIVNLDSVANFLKFYNIAAASVNPASSVPVWTVQVPSGGTYTFGGSDLPESFSTAISMRAVTGGSDTNTAAPGTSPIIELLIK